MEIKIKALSDYVLGNYVKFSDRKSVREFTEEQIMNALNKSKSFEVRDWFGGVTKITFTITNIEKDKFLNPILIEERLNAMDNPLDKLRFLYDYLYCNANKNRFALFRDSDCRDSVLYCDNLGNFDSLLFANPKPFNYKS